MNSLEIADKKAQLIKRNLEILALAKQEVRELSEEEETEFKENQDEIQNLEEEQKELDAELEKVEAEDEKEEKSKTNTTKISRDLKMKNSNYSLIEEIRNSVKTGEQIVLDRAYTVQSEGEDLVQTDVYGIIRPLEAKLVLPQAGAHFLTGLRGDVQLPIMSASNCAWAAETGDASDGSSSFSNVTLSPKRLTTYAEVSLQLLEQDTVGAEEAIRDELINAIAQKIESTVLSYNAGSATQPAGLAYNASATTISNFSYLCGMEADVEEANVYGDMKYVLSPKAKSALRGMIKGTNNSTMVYEAGEVDGTPAVTTSNVPAKYMYYGDWSKLYIATWSDIILDVVRDSASLKKGCVTLVINMYADAKLTIPEAIAVGQVE